MTDSQVTFIVLCYTGDPYLSESPTMIGPFPDEDSAASYLTSLEERFSVFPPWSYQAVHFLNAESATSPEEYLEEQRGDEDEDLVLTPRSGGES